MSDKPDRDEASPEDLLGGASPIGAQRLAGWLRRY